MATSNATLPFDEAPGAGDERLVARDRDARERAVDPRFNVALEASAGTGKTRVLVDRYVNLLRAGVDPANILAITFTRKAAAEMRDRILATLRGAAARGELAPARWRELRDRTSDIAISTIDAFCLALLREFPLEADVDPGFAVADETELPRLIDQALDGALRICRDVAREDEHVALAFAQLGERRARAALAGLLGRRLVAPRVLAASLTRVPPDLDVASAAARAAASLNGVFDAMRGGFDRFAFTGPLEPAFILLVRGLRALREESDQVGRALLDPSFVQSVLARARDYFLTQDGQPRSRSPYPRRAFASEADWRSQTDLVAAHAAAIVRVVAAYRRDLNGLVSRGIWRMYRIAETEYRRTLDAHAVLDFSDLLLRALDLVRRMDEFSRSRFRLESRYHHVLVDEFQDTSRAQWELVALLVQSWGEGAGLAGGGPLQPSIFIVGDRKQSIYGFRDADVSVLREAARHLEGLRPDRDVRRSISRSFRAVPALLAFVNDVCRDMDRATGDEAFQYEEDDQFPIENAESPSASPAEVPEEALGLVVADSPERCAEITAAEIARLVASGVPVRDRETGVPRPVRAGDVAVLFRSRESHREFEAAIARRGLRTYVYKGLGFFDADEIKDVLALVWYLAEPHASLRVAALLRSRFFGISDEALRLLGPAVGEALDPRAPGADRLSEADRRVLTHARVSTARWRALVDRIPPAELVDRILAESAYAFELRGPRLPQARENLKKVRALLRRLQNRGYATMARLAAHLDRLALGDDGNAVIDAADAVNLMTVHASKGLEFPVVFLVNLARGTANRRDPVRWSRQGTSVAVGDLDTDVDDARLLGEREETKRLSYVALTRARDRLYLATVLKDGEVAPGRGSLAEVLPSSLLATIAHAGQDREWRASSDAVHRFRVCPDDGGGTDAPVVATAAETPLATDFDPLPAGPAPARPASGSAAGFPGADVERLVGRLVHRLLQRRGFDLDSRAARDAVLGVLRPEEMRDLAAAGATSEVDRAAEAYRAICDRPELRALYASGEHFHEVPFTMRLDGVSVRGTIDCLIRSGPGRMTVLEFKTGAPREEHGTQLELYRRAAERLFGGCAIDARLVYAR